MKYLWKKATRAIAILMALTLVIGTGQTIGSAASKSAKLVTKAVTVTEGTTKDIVISNKKSARKYTYTVASKAIATVSTSGKVKGVKAGTTKISVKEKYKSKGKTISRTLGTVSVKVVKKTVVPVVTVKPTVKPVVTPTPAVTAKPTVTPVATSIPTTTPEAWVNIDLSTRVATGSKSGTYDTTTKILHMKDVESFWFPLSQSLNKGETITVKVVGNYAGTVGFRSWLIDDSQTTNSNMFKTADEVGFKSGAFDLKYVFTATTAANHLFFKGPAYGTNIDDIEISSIQVKFSASPADILAPTDPYVPLVEQDALTNSLSLTKSFSEQKGVIGNNPLITQSFVADPTAVEYNGRLYVYGTADKVEFDSKGNVIDNKYNTTELKCISSADLVNWTDHGTIDVKKATTWAQHSWAPTITSKVINSTTKFFLYYANGGDGIGVLTADSPTGPWTDPIGKRLISRDTPNCDAASVPWLFDPGVLTDDDGTGYLYFGGGVGTDKEHPKSSRVVKLGADMVSLSGDPVGLDPRYLFEDNEINKINGQYVYSYCTNWNVPSTDQTVGTANIAFMTSANPMSGFEYQGKLFSNPGTVFGNYYNNHHKLIQFKGQWYIIYHTTILEETAYGTKKGYRTLHMDKLNVSTDANGKLAVAATATYAGLDSVATLSPYANQNATNMAWNGGLKTVLSNSQKSMVLDSINTGDWLGVNNVDFGTKGTKALTMQIASDTSVGAVEIYVDAPTIAAGGKKVGNISITNTTGTDVYAKASCQLSETVSGVHKLYYVFRGKGYHVASWEFTALN